MDKIIQENIELLKKLFPDEVSIQLTKTILEKSAIDASKVFDIF